MQPGRTYLPRASITLSAGTSREAPISVIAPSALDGSGRVALTLEVTKADAQLVRSGDRIDVLAADGSGLATTVATNAAVVSVPASDVVVVAVNPTEAVKVAGARAASTFTLVLRAAS